MFNPGFTSPNLLYDWPTRSYRTVTFFGCAFQRIQLVCWLIRFRSPLLTESHVAFLSSGYLDVSVPQVCFVRLCIQRTIPQIEVGCPIRKS